MSLLRQPEMKRSTLRQNTLEHPDAPPPSGTTQKQPSRWQMAASMGQTGPNPLLRPSLQPEEQSRTSQEGKFGTNKVFVLAGFSALWSSPVGLTRYACLGRSDTTAGLLQRVCLTRTTENVEHQKVIIKG